jgi:hypothetical protein
MDGARLLHGIAFLKVSYGYSNKSRDPAEFPHPTASFPLALH